MDQLVEHWLRAETDRQLRIDFDVIEPQLETNETGELRYLPRGAHGDEGFARLLTWFEIWSEDKQLLLRHWPVPEEQIHSSLEAPPTNILRFQTTELEPGLFVRLMERPARIDRRGVIVRVFRDETEMRRTLRNIIEVSALGVPLAIVLASLGGYFIAGRSLAPMGAIVKQARRITSESLEQRLPNENPHDELGQLVTIFNETLERLENSCTELKRFTSDASHELRTPLTALRAVGEVALRDRSQAEALRETVASMLEEAERLDDLVEALLTLARGESREFSPKLESVRVGDIVNEVREEIAILATEKQRQFRLAVKRGSRLGRIGRSCARHCSISCSMRFTTALLGARFEWGAAVNQMVCRSPLLTKAQVLKRNIVRAFSSDSSALIKRVREPKEVRVWGWRSQR
jgi:signal transduction histidine kinase